MIKSKIYKIKHNKALVIKKHNYIFMYTQTLQGTLNFMLAITIAFQFNKLTMTFMFSKFLN